MIFTEVTLKHPEFNKDKLKESCQWDMAPWASDRTSDESMQGLVWSCRVWGLVFLNAQVIRVIKPPLALMGISCYSRDTTALAPERNWRGGGGRVEMNCIRFAKFCKWKVITKIKG